MMIMTTKWITITKIKVPSTAAITRVTPKSFSSNHSNFSKAVMTSG
jgi:hypothetical protein